MNFVKVFSRMKSLRVLTLTGNSVISKIQNYRKTLTLKCVSLTFIIKLRRLELVIRLQFII